MRETRHEETKTRSPGTGTPTRISGGYRGKIERNVSIPEPESTLMVAGRLARSHGGQGTNGLTLSL
ncbi:ribosome modulation factor [Klebsiella pneumoniae]|nr:ribosome modulation factor [Klebsiella pneumoniae]